MDRKRNFAGLDYARLAAAFMIIAIHTAPLDSVNKTADFLITYCLGRMAVPLFLMITGYFVLAPSIYGGLEKQEGLKQYLKKTLALFLGATALYLPFSYYAGNFSWDIRTLAKQLFFDGTFYHLWYLPAALLGSFLVVYLVKRIGLQKTTVIAVILYLVGLLGDSYYGLIEMVKPLKAFYDILFSISSYTRNGIFYAPVFLLLGVSLATGGKQKPRILWSGFIISTLLMLGEGYLTYAFDLQRHNSMYLFLLPNVYFLFALLVEKTGRAPAILRPISMWLYLLHPLTIVGIRGVVKLGILPGLWLTNSVLYYLAVCVVTLLAAFAIASVMPKPKKKEKFQKGRAWIALNKEHLKHNVIELNKMLPKGCELMPAVKANAYGHGDVMLAKELQRLGIKTFCVAIIEEGIKLRQAGIDGEILILGYTHPKRFAELRRYHLTQTVVDMNFARLLKRYRLPLKVHIGIDTGMHRLGISSQKLEDILEICSYKNLKVTGIYSHLCVADSQSNEHLEYTKEQFRQLRNVKAWLHENGVKGFSCHMQGSYGFLNYPQEHFDFVRVGIALYGAMSNPGDSITIQNKLLPVLSLKALVESVKVLRLGDGAGYGLTYTAKKEQTIAVVSIGYGDGLPRSLSNKGIGLVRGYRTPVIGRVCMDQLLLDVSSVPQVAAGDEVVFIGTSGEEEIRAEEAAALADTISNELLSRLGQRLERMWE